MIPQHKTLGAVVLFCAVILGVAYGVFLYPRQSEVATIRKRKEALERDLGKKDWPLDPARLRSHYAEAEKEQERFGRQCNQIMKQISQALSEEISEYAYSGAQEFRDLVSRLDYREEYSEVQRELRGRVNFDEAVLGLGERSDSLYVYQLLLHLWTVENLTSLALDSGLTPADHPEATRYESPDGPALPVSQISIRPMVAYALVEEDKEPYLLEFPVRLTVEGTLADVGRFLVELQNTRDKRFFPMGHIEIRKMVPTNRQPRLDRVRATIECSSFFHLGKGDTDRVPARTKKRLLPPGA